MVTILMEILVCRRRFVLVAKRFQSLIGLLIIVLLTGCGSQKNVQNTQSQPLISDSVHIVQERRPTPTPQLSILTHVTTPTPTPTLTPASTSTSTKTPSNPPLSPPNNIPGSGSGPAPYGPPPPLTTEEVQLTQQLFA